MNLMDPFPMDNAAPLAVFLRARPPVTRPSTVVKPRSGNCWIPGAAQRLRRRRLTEVQLSAQDEPLAAISGHHLVACRLA
jgi:hypothetical protein